MNHTYKAPKPSALQQEIYEAVKNVNTNISILATAGSGKTTTLIGILSRVPKARKGIFLSFSKAIVNELKERVPPHIPVSTLHALGFGLIRNYYKGIRIMMVEDKYFKNAVQIYKEAKEEGASPYLTKTEYRECKVIESVCTFARMTLTPFEELAIKDMCLHFNIEWNDSIINISLKLLNSANTLRGKAMWIDYADMIYLPAITPQMFFNKYDDIYLDEAQDTNNAQRTMVESLLKKTGRLIAVGDDFQCIYGFSGADVESFKKIRERPNTITLPLSVSYRCPKSVVRRAQEICPEMQYWEGAEEGEERLGEWREVREGDMVLSRTTKPLIGLYFKLIQQHIKANVIGKDIEQGLIDLAEECLAPTREGVVYKMNLHLEQWVANQRALGVRNPELMPQYESISEKIQVLNLILSEIESPNQLIPTINKIFAEDRQAARLMTIHRSKGLESDRVFVIEKVKGENLMPSKRATQSWENLQERNLMFVARTRSKKELIWLHMEE